MIRSILAVAATVCMVSTANAASITSLVGDIDGFGGEVTPGAVGADTGAFFDNTVGSDPLFTDVWLLEQDGGAGGSPIDYSHTYTLGAGETVDAASLSIMESGMSNGRGPWNVLFNGNLLGTITGGGETITALHTFSVNLAWLTGSSDAISLVYLDSLGEGFAIDYSQLSLTTSVANVPLPATGLMLLGALGFGALRRRTA